MSNKSMDELIEEFQKMLDETFEDSDFEDDFGNYHPPASGIAFDPIDLENESETPPPIPKNTKNSMEQRCDHKEIEKKFLFTGHYFVCKKCGKDLGS